MLNYKPRKPHIPLKLHKPLEPLEPIEPFKPLFSSVAKLQKMYGDFRLK
jgi:hypothetical protein